MASEQERDAMRRALALARVVDLTADPNPHVGCVVLDASGSPVGEGLHRGRGTAHAEVAALTAAGGRARGGTVVVTLEPCTHVGITGPCTDAIIAAGVARVVFAAADLNPTAAGGALLLRAAGVDVEAGVLADEAIALNVAKGHPEGLRLPVVTWKLAATLDGRSAAADGSSMWISCDEARRDTQLLRAASDAIVAGTGTVATDDPQLNVRDEDDRPIARERQPLRVVMGVRELPSGLRVFDDSAPTLRLRTRDPVAALSTLAAAGCGRVFLEGGPTLAAAFLRTGVVDEIVAYLTPALLGAGAAAVGDLGITNIDGIARFDLVDVAQVGSDVRLTMKVSR